MPLRKKILLNTNTVTTDVENNSNEVCLDSLESTDPALTCNEVDILEQVDQGKKTIRGKIKINLSRKYFMEVKDNIMNTTFCNESSKNKIPSVNEIYIYGELLDDIIHFETQYIPPVESFSTIPDQYPDLKFCFEYYIEGGWGSGRIFYENGETKKYEEEGAFFEDFFGNEDIKEDQDNG